MAKRKRVIPIGDYHAPWHSKHYSDRVVRFVTERQPDVVVQVGDLYDLFSWGRFPRTLNLMTPAQELAEARAAGEEFWGRIRKAAPKAKLFQLWGNHDERPIKQIIAKAPEFETFVAQGMKSLMTFDNVELVDSFRDELIIDNVCYIHGYRARLGQHTAFNLMNTVCGHTHQGGVHYVNHEGRILWELNVGYLADRFAKPLGYTAQRRMSRWTPGIGEVDGHGPRFIPFDEPKRKR